VFDCDGRGFAAKECVEACKLEMPVYIGFEPDTIGTEHWIC